MKAYWLPGISRYRRTKTEAKAEASVSPYNRVDLPDRPRDWIDLLNDTIAQHERTLAASDAAYMREEATAQEMGYASLRQALEALRVMRGGEPAATPAP